MARFLLNRPVVVGIDDSPYSLAALEWAARFAVRHRHPLRMVHVPGRHLDETESLQRRVAATLAAMNPSPTWVAWKVRPGSAAEILSEEAVAARLLVLGHREPRPVIGSTLRGVLIRGVGRVAVVPGSWTPDPAPSRRIVVGIRDRRSVPALDLAYDLAVAQGSTLCVVHVTRRPVPHPDRTVAQETRRIEAEGHAIVQTVLDEVNRRVDVPLDVQVVQGDPGEVLLRASSDAELLVLGGRLWAEIPVRLGSVVEQSLIHGDRPVAIAHPSRRRPLRQSAGDRSRSSMITNGTAGTRVDELN
ncbi:universal stress protein [Microlunatus sp. GCM10028923]|uniref:universal stress protein n=1 Tax=Microlunatus sp. GCM10028923 TaxID=3273400 RepID=UPI0036239413